MLYLQVPVNAQLSPFFGHCQINYFGISLLLCVCEILTIMFSTTFPIIDILLVTLLYLQFNESAFYITVWKYKRLTR